MPFLRVLPDDADLVAAGVAIVNAARRVDDPTTPPEIDELAARWLRWGWDLEPDERYLYVPEGAAAPVGVLDVGMPMRDNRHLVWAEVCVHPQHRRRGHGTVMLAEVMRRAEDASRPTIWLGAAADDPGAEQFLQRSGFRYASHDARRRQRLAEVDQAELAALHAEAEQAASAYRLERLIAPVADDVLAELVEVTAAINDAPMGELTFEDEHFDVARLRDQETARAGRGDIMYRVIARHRDSGVVGGHTVMVVNPLRPDIGHQGDTAVSREHRGHRLGLLLKIDMLRWLAEVEPQLAEIETWNNADNQFMIDVNIALGYRLSRVYTMYELNRPRSAASHSARSADLVDAGRS